MSSLPKRSCALFTAASQSALLVTSSWSGRIALPYFSTRSFSVPRSGAVAATLSPRSRAAMVHSRPKPREVPVMNQVLVALSFDPHEPRDCGPRNVRRRIRNGCPFARGCRWTGTRLGDGPGEEPVLSNVLPSQHSTPTAFAKLSASTLYEIMGTRFVRRMPPCRPRDRGSKPSRFDS